MDKNKMHEIRNLAGDALKCLPENVVLDGKGAFRGAVSPTVRNTVIKKEEILYALHEARETLERIFTVAI